MLKHRCLFAWEEHYHRRLRALMISIRYYALRVVRQLLPKAVEEARHIIIIPVFIHHVHVRALARVHVPALAVEEPAAAIRTSITAI